MTSEAGALAEGQHAASTVDGSLVRTVLSGAESAPPALTYLSGSGREKVQPEGIPHYIATALGLTLRPISSRIAATEQQRPSLPTMTTA